MFASPVRSGPAHIGCRCPARPVDLTGARHGHQRRCRHGPHRHWCVRASRPGYEVPDCAMPEGSARVPIVSRTAAPMAPSPSDVSTPRSGTRRGSAARLGLRVGPHATHHFRTRNVVALRRAPVARRRQSGTARGRRAVRHDAGAVGQRIGTRPTGRVVAPECQPARAPARPPRDRNGCSATTSAARPATVTRRWDAHVGPGRGPRGLRHPGRCSSASPKWRAHTRTTRRRLTARTPTVCRAGSIYVRSRGQSVSRRTRGRRGRGPPARARPRSSYTAVTIASVRAWWRSPPCGRCTPPRRPPRIGIARSTEPSSPCRRGRGTK